MGWQIGWPGLWAVNGSRPGMIRSGDLGVDLREIDLHLRRNIKIVGQNVQGHVGEDSR